MRSAASGRDISEDLHADDHDDVAATGFDLGHRLQDGHTARGACRFVARGGQAGEVRVRRDRHASEKRLTGEDLRPEVGDVDRVDSPGRDVRVPQGTEKRCLEHSEQVVGRPLDLKVGLVAAEDENSPIGHVKLLCGW
ncbi:hypothetical protein LUW74_30310 [Actinomadura madurae]|nr:hypothetical protein [Actinomadura madurae]URN07197.1 hypothetical protein LUW74_30310 [Actinomadura madurae]